MPWEIKNYLSSYDINTVPLTECMYAGIPNMEKKCVKCLITTAVETSWYSRGEPQKLVNNGQKILFLVFVGRGPLNSRFNLSNGETSFKKFPAYLSK